MGERTCTMPDCDRKHFARDLCHRHYKAAGHGFTPQPCVVPGCDGRTTRHTANGLCTRHHTNMRRHGTVEPTRFYPAQGMTLADVLFTRSAPSGDCVLWTGPLGSEGYPGEVREQGLGQRSQRAHRMSWIMANGPIPRGMALDHVCHTIDPTCEGGPSCRHRRCINPDHLEVVTPAENNIRQAIQRRARIA